MSVKINNTSVSDIVIGASGGGKVNIDKIVIGNSDNTGTTIWQRITERFVTVGPIGSSLSISTPFSNGICTSSTLSGLGSSIESVAYGNGRFIAVGGGKCYSLADGASTWVDMGSISNVEKVTYGNGRFVAVGIDGDNALCVYSLSDGASTWVPSTLDISDDFSMFSTPAIAYGNNRFIVVSDIEEIISYSSDLSQYTAIMEFNGDANGSFNSVAYGGGRFVVVGVRSYIISDGSTDKTEITGFSNSNPVIAYGNGRFVVVGGGTSQVLNDGSLTVTGLDGINGTDYINCIAYGGGRFVAVGNGVAYYLNDGLTRWTKLNNISDTLYGIAYGN